MKAVLISIQPKWCELIARGKKTVEVRKTKPKIETPFKCYIYESKGTKKYFSQPSPIPYYEGKGKVIGEFVCDSIIQIGYNKNGYGLDDFVVNGVIAKSCIPEKEIYHYLQGKKPYLWHISNLIIYNKPKELREFKKINQPCWYGEMGISKRDCYECKSKDCFIQRPPQSWCYVEEMG